MGNRRAFTDVSMRSQTSSRGSSGRNLFVVVLTCRRRYKMHAPRVGLPMTTYGFAPLSAGKGWPSIRRRGRLLLDIRFIFFFRSDLSPAEERRLSAHDRPGGIGETNRFTSYPVIVRLVPGTDCRFAHFSKAPTAARRVRSCEINRRE